MKKTLILVALAAIFLSVGPTKAQTMRTVDWLDGDSGIVLEGGVGPNGYVIGVLNDTLAWVPRDSGSVDVGVTSVALAAPTGFSVSGSPVTSSGTLTLSFASGYQGYTSAEASKLSGIAAGATNNPSTTVGANFLNLTNPSALGYVRTNADNTVTYRSYANVLSDIGGAPLASPTFTGTVTLPATVSYTSNGSIVKSGNHALTLTTTATTNATFPAGTSTLYGTGAGTITSAQLATSLTNETGTGVAVFNIGPTFTGTATFERVDGQYAEFDTLNVGVVIGGGELDSLVLSGETPGDMLTTNGTGRVVSNNAFAVGTNQIAFFNGTLVSQQSLSACDDGTNPVTQTQFTKACIDAMVSLLRAYNLAPAP